MARAIRRIGCIGEAMIELVAESDGAARLGVAGDTYNTAVYLARCLAGTDIAVSFVTALGQDGFSDRILDHMAVHGVGTGHVERRPGKLPGLYAIETDVAGERSFTYWRSDSAARTLFAEPARVGLTALDDFDLVLLSGITLAILPPGTRTALMAALDGFRESGGLVAYDSNHRPRLWDSAEAARAANLAIWARTDIALPSVDDEMAIFGETAPTQVLARLRRLGLRRGALKRGPQGPLGLGETGGAAVYPAVARVVDTTAAGDSFNAGFLAELARGGDETAALAAGHRLAATVIQAKGAIVPT